MFRSSTFTKSDYIHTHIMSVYAQLSQTNIIQKDLILNFKNAAFLEVLHLFQNISNIIPKLMKLWHRDLQNRDKIRFNFEI